jgi:ribonucleoside-diphosphate reductase alpha chain
MPSSNGPQTASSLAIFQQKYAQKGETYRDVCNRVSSGLADNDGHYRAFRSILLEGRFSPGGRILSSLGTTKKVTPYNCFVSGVIEDKLRGPDSIMDRLDQAVETMRRGGGIGYDFSTLRPRGSLVRSLDSHSTGPVAFMAIFDAAGSTIASTGERRGAQMGILRVDHPDIEEFIHAKQNSNRLNRFNLSIAITDAFMQAVEHGEDFPLQFEGRTFRHVDAGALWETIMRSTWDWGEPGVIFIDTINRMNNLSYCETIGATNPCSEQPLPPFGACLLGSFNLVKYLMPKAGPIGLDSMKGRYILDLDRLAEDVGPVVRAMDNVVDVAAYPLPEQRQMAIKTRRMGLGVMGLANAVEACGYPYGTTEFIGLTDDILRTLKNKAYQYSVTLAREKGAFPAYTQEYLSRPFIRGLDVDIGEHGIRNSHLTSIAPTGTISMCMDNISSGIEPTFSTKSQRVVEMTDGPETHTIYDYGFRNLGITPRTALEVTAEAHIAVLTAAQKHVDSAVSKTCNVPSNMLWPDFKELYMNAWKQGAKGCATFQDGGKRAGLLQPMECASGVCSA